MNRIYFRISLLFVASVAPFAQASDPPPTFSQLVAFPAVPAAWGIKADALGNGRFILYDGDAIIVEDAVGIDSWTTVANGYVGDPGFIAVAPDGHTCLVGAGWAGQVWLFDANAPVDAGSAQLVATVASSYSAEFIDSARVLIDAAPTGAAELGILDVTTGVYRTVVNNRPDYSAEIAVDPSGQAAYAAHAGWNIGGETYAFSVNALVTAYDTGTPLDWSVGNYIGTYNNGGVADVSDKGALIIPGVDVAGGTLDNGVQFVDPATGIASGNVQPAGPWASYGPVYNGFTGRLLIICASWPGPSMTAYLSDTHYEGLPATNMAGTLVLLLGIALVARRMLRKRQHVTSC